MKVLLTGALGYIGCETLLRFSQRKDITVYAVDNDISAIRDRGAYFARFPNIKIICADITKHLNLPNADIVVHLAAKVGYTVCNNDPETTHLVNVVGTQNIASLRIPTVFFSTGSVYGSIGHSCDEQVPVNPKTVYSLTKYQGESIVKTNPYVIFRPATAYGLGMKTRHDLLIHDLARQAVVNKLIDLYQPNAIRSFYSIQKLAELIEYTCDHFDLFQGEIFNIGAQSGNISKQQAINLIKQHVDFNYNIIDGLDEDCRDYVVNYNKLQKVWPNYDEQFNDKIQNIVNYYKQQLI